MRNEIPYAKHYCEKRKNEPPHFYLFHKFLSIFGKVDKNEEKNRPR